MFGESVLQQTIGMHMDTNCAPPSRRLVPLFVRDRLHSGASEEKRKETRFFNFRYIDDILSLHNCHFGDSVDRIYRLEIKAATDAAKLASYTDLHLDIDNEGRLRTNITTKEIPISPL
jgi:hypothetical protein